MTTEKNKGKIRRKRGKKIQNESRKRKDKERKINSWGRRIEYPQYRHLYIHQWV
jgi:hypothetical protein